MSNSNSITEERFKEILKVICNKDFENEHVNAMDAVEEIKKLIMLEINK